MALHPEFPSSPYAIPRPDQRWFPASEDLRSTAYENLLPPLVAKIREQVSRFGDASPARKTDNVLAGRAASMPCVTRTRPIDSRMHDATLFHWKCPMINDPLTRDELFALDEFLGSPALGDTSMDVSAMEGFFAALAVGPRTVMPSQWLPWIWDMLDGEAQPAFAGTAEADAVLQLIMRQYNAVIHAFIADPAGFQPIYLSGDQWGVTEWCEGFLTGMRLDLRTWSPMLAAQPSWIAPFMRLCKVEDMALTDNEHDAGRWLDEVVPSLVKMHAFWREQRASVPAGVVEDDFLFGADMHRPMTRATPKVGRNDPCPCGSGGKFKKCCGSGSATLH